MKKNKNENENLQNLQQPNRNKPNLQAFKAKKLQQKLHKSDRKLQDNGMS